MSNVGNSTRSGGFRHRYAVGGGLIIVLVLAGILLVSMAYYHVPDALQHRLSQAETLDGAHLQPPGLLQWPRLAYGSVLARCTLCSKTTSFAQGARNINLAWLIRDDALAGLVGSNAPNRPYSSAEVPLPRLVWLVTWQGPCWTGSPHGGDCMTYDIVDDQTGFELDASQVALN